MENENWYRQLLALILLSTTRAAVEWITNPSSREDATKQLRGALADIDYDAAARAVTRAIENMADTSKGALNETIDTIRDRGIDAVDDAKSKAEKKLAKKGGNKRRFLIGLVIGGLIAYFMLDEQRRDDLLDRLTGASGPIEQAGSGIYQQATNTAQQAAEKAPEAVKDAAQSAASEASKAAEGASSENAG